MRRLLKKTCGSSNVRRILNDIKVMKRPSNVRRITNDSKVSEVLTQEVGGSSNAVQKIPNDIMISEVFSRVAATSSSDLSNLKMTCKDFNEMGEDKRVYQSVSLDKFPIVQWNPLSVEQMEFLSKCKKYENPEVMYRDAVIYYFNKSDFGSACIQLRKAMRLNHVGAFYVTCIIFLLCGDSKYREFGLKSLSRFKYEHTKEEVSACRSNLMKMLSMMWVNNPRLKDPPMFCTNPSENCKKQTWGGDDECNNCEACSADKELKVICSTYNYV